MSRAGHPEGALTSFRLYELRGTPIPGAFDREHLQKIHAYIFQDLPDLQPGRIRTAVSGKIRTKNRALEDQSIVYPVYYLSGNVSQQIDTVLSDLRGPSSLTGLSNEAAADRMARLYGDLDYAHGFYEGNSRTLREFTRCLAGEAGYDLNWVRTGIGADERNHLYMARDLAVLERALLTLPGPFHDGAIQSVTMLRNTGLTLEGMFRKNLTTRAREISADRSAESSREKLREQKQPLAIPHKVRSSFRERLLKQFSKDSAVENEYGGNDDM